jgi:hypothetical protein
MGTFVMANFGDSRFFSRYPSKKVSRGLSHVCAHQTPLRPWSMILLVILWWWSMQQSSIVFLFYSAFDSFASILAQNLVVGHGHSWSSLETKSALFLLNSFVVLNQKCLILNNNQVIWWFEGTHTGLSGMNSGLQVGSFFAVQRYVHDDACMCRTSVIMTLWPTHISIHDVTTKYPKPAILEDFWFATFSHETHLIHTATSEESLRVLFLTRSLTVDLVH